MIFLFIMIFLHFPYSCFWVCPSLNSSKIFSLPFWTSFFLSFFKTKQLKIHIIKKEEEKKMSVLSWDLPWRMFCIPCDFPLKKARFPSPSSYQVQTSSWFRVELFIYFFLFFMLGFYLDQTSVGFIPPCHT